MGKLLSKIVFIIAGLCNLIVLNIVCDNKDTSEILLRSVAGSLFIFIGLVKQLKGMIVQNHSILESGNAHKKKKTQSRNI